MEWQWTKLAPAIDVIDPNCYCNRALIDTLWPAEQKVILTLIGKGPRNILTKFADQYCIITIVTITFESFESKLY